MSALEVPQISLEQARELVSLLEQEEQEAANLLLMDIASGEQNSKLFSEIGKLTRQLHDSITNFHLDTKIADLAQEALPDAKERLSYVLDMTEKAANKTMDAVEESMPIAEKMQRDVSDIRPTWDRLMSRDLKVGEFKKLCHELDEFIKTVKGNTQDLHDQMNEVLMAQEYQDITGQVIRRVIELVREVEESLVHLLKVFGNVDDGQTSEQKQTSNQQAKVEELDTVAEGPIMHAEARDDVVHSQDEVDDLLSSLGF